MRLAFYGSSLLASNWNGAALCYRGILRALSARGYAITFYEPNIHGRWDHPDHALPDWCRVEVYEGTIPALQRAAADAAAADIVIKASNVGFEDDRLLVEVMDRARPDALRVFWDDDPRATLAELRDAPDHPLGLVLPELDLVLLTGGAEPLVAAYRRLGATACVALDDSVDDPSLAGPTTRPQAFALTAAERLRREQVCAQRAAEVDALFRASRRSGTATAEAAE